MILEISVRAFYTSEEGVNAVPKTVVLVHSENQIKLDVVAAALGKALEGAPLKLREMTEEEIRQYLKDEEAEALEAQTPKNRHERRAAKARNKSRLLGQDGEPLDG